MQYVWSYAFIICTYQETNMLPYNLCKNYISQDFFPKNKIGYYADNVIYMIFTETVFPFLKSL